MLNEGEYFEFEDKNGDFPFYKNQNFLHEKSGLILLGSILLFVFLIFGPIKFYDFQEQVILTFITLIPLLYALKGNFGLLFRKLEPGNLRTILLSSAGYFIYVIIITIICMALESVLGFNIINSPHVATESLELIPLLFQFIQIIGEELFRVILFLIVLAISYKYTNNRKKSIVIGALVALLGFGLMHLNSYPNIMYCIIMMGLGTFFEMYPYLKTKNVLLSIIVHFIINILITIIHLT